MKKLLNDCIEEIKKKENAKTAGGKVTFNHQIPKNPSIIVNYNLAKKNAEEYYNFLKNIWPVVDQNIPKTDCMSDFGTIENTVRSNNNFERFNEIHIHLLVDLVECNVEDFFKMIEKKFSKPIYKIIVHEFMDYQVQARVATLEDHFMELMKEQGKIHYRFIYSNRRVNGGMWTGENASKIWRLAANVTAIMSMSERYFSNGSTYTFSYNLLEKPTWKILQFTIGRLLENISSYAVNPNTLKKNFTESFQKSLDEKAKKIIKNKEFSPESFEYLPSNKKINKEKKDVNKSIRTLEKGYPQAASCVQAMIRERIKEVAVILSKEKPDFSKEISEKLSYYELNGFMPPTYDQEELIKELTGDLRSRLFLESESDKSGTYSEILKEYANEKLKRIVLEELLKCLEQQLLDKVTKAQNIDSWIQEWKKATELQISTDQEVKNLEACYGTKVDGYWKDNQNALIKQIDECSDQQGLWETLNKILTTLFDKVSIYYESFEKEINERVGNNTATLMFKEIDKDDNVENNFCFNLPDLQSQIKMQRAKEVVLLINPESELLKVNTKNEDKNYEKLELNRLDCVERIDFATLELKK